MSSAHVFDEELPPLTITWLSCAGSETGDHSLEIDACQHETNSLVAIENLS